MWGIKELSSLQFCSVPFLPFGKILWVFEQVLCRLKMLVTCFILWSQVFIHSIFFTITEVWTLKRKTLQQELRKTSVGELLIFLTRCRGKLGKCCWLPLLSSSSSYMQDSTLSYTGGIATKEAILKEKMLKRRILDSEESKTIWQVWKGRWKDHILLLPCLYVNEITRFSSKLSPLREWRLCGSPHWK